MTTLVFDDVNMALWNRLRTVLEDGDRYAPRGKPVTEVMVATLEAAADAAGFTSPRAA